MLVIMMFHVIRIFERIMKHYMKMMQSKHSLIEIPVYIQHRLQVTRMKTAFCQMHRHKNQNGVQVIRNSSRMQNSPGLMIKHFSNLLGHKEMDMLMVFTQVKWNRGKKVISSVQ